MTLDQISKKLQEDFTQLGLSFEIREVYIDLGANWKAETIVVVNQDGRSYQALSPAQINMMSDGRGSEVYKELHSKISKRGW